MTTNEIQPRDRLIIALDVASADEALRVVRELAREVSFFKIGLQLFTAAGPDVVRAVVATGAKVFLDLKLHDIPNTVAKAVAAASQLRVAMLTVHLSGGSKMLQAAADAAPADLLLLGVTVLTSADDATMREIGVDSTVEEQTLRLAAVGSVAGIRGLIASPLEVARLRKTLGETTTIITPGVRPAWSAADDQKRFTTPAEALRNGANYLVIGRPVTADRDPREAVRRIIAEL
ncbi:MAG TPA: orotidine-5'-phosphate decarboxylase [Chthoniobacterales bacterium]